MTDESLEHVRSVLADRGLVCQHIAVLSACTSGRKRHRQTLRVDLGDGSTIKVRRLESVEAAVTLTGMRRPLHPAFAPILAQHDAMLIEEWIDGQVLTTVLGSAHAHDLGALLGHLHSTPHSASSQRFPTAGRRERAVRQLGMLTDAAVISHALSDALQRDLSRTDPRDTAHTIVHLDYCPENVVRDPNGGLHVIDNEWITVDGPGLDLGRVYTRWPMADPVWQRFLTGYRTTAPFDPGPLRFWMIVMAVAGAAIRQEQPGARLAEPVARLHELAALVEG